MNDRTLRLLLFFVFAFGFMFLWDYVFVRPKREALKKAEIEKRKVEVAPKKKELSIKPLKLVEIALNGYSYTVDLRSGVVYSLKDRKHKSEPKGYIIKPLRVKGEVAVDLEKKEVHGKGFSYRFLKNFSIDFNQNDLIPIQLTTPTLQHDESADLLIKPKEDKFHKIGYKNANLTFRADTLIWFGLRSRYYLVAVAGFKGKVVSFKDGERITLRLYPDSSQNFKVFFGPSEREVLSSFNPPLEEAFDLGGGWLRWMVWPIYWVLVFFYRIVHDYGVAIMLLSLALKVILSPLYVNMYRSTSAMKKLQPKLKKIQELYKDDPERLQWETMKLYREAGVNPLGGCLPMILMLPVFWALYQVLRNAIELKGTSFLWVQDLSSKDPYYALPIIMGAISAANAWFQPAADPNTRRTSLLMSIIFVFIFLNLPAGIVLYWLTYSLFGLIEQRIYNYILKI